VLAPGPDRWVTTCIIATYTPVDNVKTAEISNWAELLEEVYRDTWDPRIERYRSPWVFGGLDSPESGLLTGLTRLSPNEDDVLGPERNPLASPCKSPP
jgi:hypothetical protein